MSFLKKIKHGVDKTFRKVGLSRRASKVARQLVSNDVVGLLRSVQRSHKLGKVGHSLAPSMSESNQLTRALNSIQKSISRSATRAAASNQAVTSAKSYTQSLPTDILSNRLDYRYRRFGGLM